MTDDRWLLVASLTSLRASIFNPAVARSSVGSGAPSNSLFFSAWVVMIFPFRIPRTEVGKISMVVLQTTTAGLATFLSWRVTRLFRQAYRRPRRRTIGRVL